MNGIKDSSIVIGKSQLLAVCKTDVEVTILQLFGVSGFCWQSTGISAFSHAIYTHFWSNSAEHSGYCEKKPWCWKMKCLHFISIKYFSLSSQKILMCWHFSRDDPRGVLRGEGGGAVGGARPQAKCRPGPGSEGRGQIHCMWHWSVNNNEHDPPSPLTLWWQDMHSAGAMGSNAASARLNSESNENSVRNWERESERCYRKRGDNFPKLPRQSHWRTSAKVSQVSHIK